MTFTQTALALVQEHAALTHELDRLSRAQDEIPSLETALAYLRNAMPSAEDRIIKGRAKLRQEWSSHLFEVQGRASALVTIGSRVGSAKMKAKEADERVKLDQQERCAHVLGLRSLGCARLTGDRSGVSTRRLCNDGRMKRRISTR